MAIYTPLLLEDAKTLAASKYGLSVLSVFDVVKGSVNSSYGLTLADGRTVFLRIFEDADDQGALRNVQLSDHLAERGVVTPRPLRRVGTDLQDNAARYLCHHLGKPVAIFPWVAGESVCQGQVTEAKLRTVGAALAQIHRAGADLPDPPLERFGPRELLGQVEAALLAAPLSLRPVLEHLAQELKAQGAEPELPCETLIHGDLFRDNVLWVGEELSAILDLESASKGCAAYDLMVTLLAWCYGETLDLRLGRALCQGYEGVRPLSEGERGRIYRAALWAALRFSVTRVLSFEIRRPPGGFYRDYQRFLGRRRALQELGQDQFLRDLGLCLR